MDDRVGMTASAKLRALSERLALGPLTVWATLREDLYETLLGDGCYAYLDQVFLTPTEAALAVEGAMEGVEAGDSRWHIRRYDLQTLDGRISMRPAPTEQEPTTLEALAEILAIAGNLMTDRASGR
jgi:hypothetical protein